MKFDINEIVILIVGMLTIINLLLLLINNSKVKKLKKHYERALSKFNSHENINDEFQSIYDRLNEVEGLTNNTVDKVNNLLEKMKSNVQKIGFVKYNAYDDTDNKLSFALVLLDEHENGILINHIYSKHGSNFYAKLVSEGKVEERISEEEAFALKMAVEDKEFKERRISEVKRVIRKKKLE